MIQRTSDPTARAKSKVDIITTTRGVAPNLLSDLKRLFLKRNAFLAMLACKVVRPSQTTGRI